MAKKHSFAQLKRDCNGGKISMQMLVWRGETNIPQRIKGLRKVTRANSVGIFFRNENGEESSLYIPRAMLADYTDDYLITYEPAVRNPYPEEQAVLDGWKKIAETEEFRAQAYADALTDGSSTYWREKSYFANSKYPYLFGFEESQGCKAIRGGKDHGKIRDKNIRGNIEMIYRVYHHDANGQVEERPCFANWRCDSYVLADTEDGYEKEYGYCDLASYFVLDGTYKTVCYKAFGPYCAGDICSVKQGWYTGFVIRKEI